MDGLKLINPEFDFEFAGSTYKVKKANLSQIILFQKRFAELTEQKDASIEKKIAGYCVYLILSGVKADATEEWVNGNLPDVEMTDILEYFGFMNRQKVELLRKVLNREDQLNAPIQRTGEQSSQ